MSRLETDPQALAADPTINAFVTANAGSGKTKTLIDRVARLLLAGSRPAAILCVTYTKAAAAEMQRRLFGLLGKWAVLDDDALRQALSELEGRAPENFDDAALSRARALFAAALETPGGLKIQTIHAFCEALLRRFPLEAGIAPGFQVMDDAQAGAIAKAAREAVALYAGAGGGLIADAYARMSVALDFQAFQSMFAAFENQRGALATYFDAVGDDLPANVWGRCGFDAPSSAEAEGAAIMGRLDRPLWRAVAEVLNAGTATDQKNAALLMAVAADPDATFEQACRPLFTGGGEGTPATWPAKTSGLKAREDLRGRLLEQQALLEAGRERIAAARVAEDTVMALSLAKAYVLAYQAEKTARAALDFADLIERTEELLTRRSDAAWVLYKLDGGIDHLLLDEAQDTAPEQWAIIRALTAEFFAGAGVEAGRGARQRTLFVVGDEKQSIYSFQGADPALFLSETERYRREIRAAGMAAERVPLTTSYRSTREVLSFVDAVFEAEATRAAVPPPAEQEKVAHSPFRPDGRGCVDLWPLVREPQAETREAWDAPLDDRGEMSANRRLAMRIATEIGALVARGDAVFDPRRRAWRPAGFGDVLILVRRRGALFEEILRALKYAKVPVAGADRLQLSAHIVFDDLLALARFCLYPDDDLTLAGLLKSPFVGLDDAAVYALARPRGKESLWAALQARAGEQPAWRSAADFLGWARTESGRLAPFELFARALDRLDGDGRSMRQRFLTRLGAEAADALAEFLAQAAAAEQRGVRDLETLAAAFAGLEIVVKREMDEARGEVRVMTTHGSKGLEAPIVILPEITFGGAGRAPPLLRHRDAAFGDGFLWCSSKAGDCGASAAAREARAQAEAAESLRLLYVALTRARDRLILCGRIAANAKVENIKGWHPSLSAAFAAQGVAPHLRQLARGAAEEDEEEFVRFGDDPIALGAAPAPPAAQTAIPGWTREPPPAEAPAWRYAQPSRAAEAEHGPSPSPLAQAGGLGRYRRGEIIHRLLQLLPDLDPAQRRAAAGRLLASEQLSPEQQAEMTDAALGVLEDPVFAAVFAPGSRAEAAIAGAAPELPGGLRISGRVDRLSVTPDRVLVVDFKTNRPAPARIEAADGAYLTQMALYWAVLKQLFPGRAVEAALVWTDGPKLMPVPEELLARALQSLHASVDR